MTTTLAVSPIIIGFPFDQSIAFVDGSGNPPAGFDLTTASRIFGEARIAPGKSNELLAQFDSAAMPATLTVINANTIRWTLSVAATWKLGAAIAAAAAAVAAAATGPTGPAAPPSIWIDFARDDAGVWSLLPMQLNWPIFVPVTAPPA